jgi:hypothetical protein
LVDVNGLEWVGTLKSRVAATAVAGLIRDKGWV